MLLNLPIIYSLLEIPLTVIYHSAPRSIKHGPCVMHHGSQEQPFVKQLYFAALILCHLALITHNAPQSMNSSIPRGTKMSLRWRMSEGVKLLYLNFCSSSQTFRIPWCFHMAIMKSTQFINLDFFIKEISLKDKNRYNAHFYIQNDKLAYLLCLFNHNIDILGQFKTKTSFSHNSLSQQYTSAILHSSTVTHCFTSLKSFADICA